MGGGRWSDISTASTGGSVSGLSSSMSCVSVSVVYAGGVAIAPAAGSDGMDRGRGALVEEKQLLLVEPLLRLPGMFDWTPQSCSARTCLKLGYLY